MKRYHLAQNYIIQYGVEKSTYEYFVESLFFAQSNHSIYKLSFDTKFVVLLLVVPEIEATRSSGHFSPTELVTRLNYRGERGVTFSLEQPNLLHNSHTIIVSSLSCLKFLGIKTAKQNSKKNTQKTRKSHLVYVTWR